MMSQTMVGVSVTLIFPQSNLKYPTILATTRITHLQIARYTLDKPWKTMSTYGKSLLVAWCWFWHNFCNFRQKWPNLYISWQADLNLAVMTFWECTCCRSFIFLNFWHQYGNTCGLKVPNFVKEPHKVVIFYWV